jgi:Rha family phage regulatory protein
MENLIKQSEQLMTSIQIAEYTGKRHADLMRDIRNMEPAWDKINGRKFALVEYTDKKGESRPMYELTKRECLYIATKFNDEARAKLIIRWEELELKNKIDFEDAGAVLKLAQNWYDEQKKRIEAEKTIKKLEPKAELMQRVLDTDNNIDIGQAAKILELPFGRNTLFKKLREIGIFFKNRNEPMQEYVQRGYFILKEKLIARQNHEDFTVVKILVTQKGLEFLSNQFKATPKQKSLALIK